MPINAPKSKRQRPKGFGFIEFADIRDAEAAVKEHDGTELLGRTITLEFAKNDRKTPQQMRSRCVVRLHLMHRSCQQVVFFFHVCSRRWPFLSVCIWVSHHSVGTVPEAGTVTATATATTAAALGAATGITAAVPGRGSTAARGRAIVGTAGRRPAAIAPGRGRGRSAGGSPRRGAARLCAEGLAGERVMQDAWSWSGNLQGKAA